MLVDSNILIYAMNVDSSKHKLALKFLTETNKSLEIADQNIFETLRIITHPKFPSPMQPKNAIRSLLTLTANFGIITPNRKTQIITLQFIQMFNIKGTHIFDAYLAATALSNDINVIATDNTRDFEKFKEIKVLNPFKEG